MRVPNCFLFALVALAVAQDPCSGQAAQAVAGIREVAREEYQKTVDAALARVTSSQSVYRQMLQQAEAATGAAARLSQVQLLELVAAGEEVVESRDDPERLEAAVRRYYDLEAALPLSLKTGRQELSKSLGENTQKAMMATSVPQAHALVKDVVFTVGSEASFGNATTFSAGISTNLLGAAAGAAFGLLGSDGLKEYFDDNVSAGTSIPMGGKGNLAAQLGLGLGGFNLKRFTVWPVLHLESTDTADHRLPAGLAAFDTTEGTWSSPLLSIAIVPYSKETVAKRLKQGRFVAIPILGLRAPFYYPGNVFEALTAMFTDSRGDFRRAGDVQLVLGVSFPLLRVKSDTTKAERSAESRRQVP